MTATTVKKTKVVLGMDYDPLKKEAKEAGSAIKNLSQEATSDIAKMAKLAVASIASIGISNFFKDSMGLAIQAGETFNKFAVVFEDALGKAEIAAANLVDNYGLSELAAKKLLSATGDLLTGLGAQDEVALSLSEKVQQLSVDIASFQNLQGGAARASEIITKAMLGERDALTALGVKILEADVQHQLLLRGQQNLTGQAMLLAKAQITIDEVMKQSGKAIGDYARTADSTANQIRVLGNRFEDFKIAVGNSIVQNEGFQVAMKAVNDLITDKAFIDSVANIGANLVEMFASALPVAADLIKIASGLISVISELKDVVIPLGLAFGAYFATTKLTPFFEKAVSGFNALKASVKQTTIDLETGAIKSSGAMNKLGDAIKNMPTAVKIGVAVFGAQIAGKLLADLADTISNLHDEGMALIIKDAEETTAKAHALTKEFLDFQRAGDEYAKAFQKARQEIKDFIKPTDDALTRQSKMKMWLEKLVPEWGKYQDALKAAGAKAGELNVPLSENESIFEKTRRTIGGFTQNELKSFLAEQKKLGNLTGLQVDQLKELWKQTEKARQEYDKLSTSVGILAGQALRDANREAANLAKIFKANELTFSDMSTQSELFHEKLHDLIEKFGGLKNSPKILQELNEKFHDLTVLPEFDQDENLKEFGDVATELNTNVLPDTQGEIDTTTDRVKKLNEEMGDEVTKQFAEDIKNLTSNVVKVGTAALDFAGNLGILGEKGQEVGADLLNSFQNVGATIASFASGDIIGGITGIFNSLSSIGELISDIFGGASGEMEAAERRLQGLTGVTDDWAEKIEALAQEMGGADSAGRAFNSLLDDIIRSTEITTDNFATFIQKTREIVSTFEQGNASAQETAANFGAAFTEMAKAAENLGQMGGEQMTGLILLAEEFGLEVKEIAEFVESKNIAAFDAWKKSVEVFGDASIAVFDELRHEEEIMAMIPDEIKAGIEGLTGALINLSDANRLNADEVSVFEEKTLAAIAALEEQGVAGTDSILPLQDLLNRLAYLQSEYGFELDETIQKLIDEGKASGDITGDILSDGEKQIKLQERQVEVLEMIAKHFGVITDNIETMGNVASGITNGMISDFNDASNGLSSIADTINKDVIPAIGQMGDINDDVMWENSIIPDLQDWNASLGIIRSSIKTDIIAALTEMGKTYDEIQAEINDNPLLQDVNLENLRDEFNNVFRDITSNARTGSRALSEALAAGTQLGFGVDVEAFREENLEAALESFTAIKDIGDIDLGDIKREIWKTERELKKLREGTVAYDEMSEKLDALKQNLSDVTAAQEVFGDLSIGILDEMYALQQKVGENPVLVEGIQSATDLLADFSKAQELTADEYQDFEDIVAKSFQELLGAGFTREEALNVIGPMLEQLDFLNNEFDLSIDDLTQELIDEGKKLGAVGEIQKSETEQMVDALGIMTTVLSALVESLGVELPENIMSIIDEMVGAGVDAVGEFSDRVRDGIGADISEVSPNIDIKDRFLFDPLFDPQVNVQGQTIPGLTSGGIGAGMAGTDGIVAEGTKTINLNMTVNITVDDPQINTIELSDKFKTVLRDNVGGAVDVMVDAIDAAA